MAKPKSQNPESTFKKPPLTTKCRKLSDHSKRTSGARGALGATPRTRHGTFTTIKQKPALRDRKVSPPSQPTRPRRPQNGKNNFLKTSCFQTTMFSTRGDWKECTPAQLTPWEVVLPKGSAEWRRSHRLNNSEEFILKIIPQNRIHK